MFQPFVILAALGSLYAGVRFINNLNLEFEVIVTNGGMDVDKIIARVQILKSLENTILKLQRHKVALRL